MSPEIPFTRKVILILVVFSAAGILWWSVGGGSRGGGSLSTAVPPPEPVGGRDHAEWYQSNQEFWEDLDYVPLDDRDAVAGAVSELVDRAHSTSPIDYSNLKDNLTTLLYALGSDGPDTYLKRLSPWRSLQSRLRESTSHQAHALYHLLTGQVMPSAMSAREVFDGFWSTPANPVGRPKFLGRGGAMKLGHGSKKESETSVDDALIAYLPKFEGEELSRWIGHAAQGLPIVTEGAHDIVDICRSERKLAICKCFLPLKTPDGKYVICGVVLYKAPSMSDWDIVWVTSYYPRYIFWPI